MLDASTAETTRGKLSPVSDEPRVLPEDFAAALKRSQEYLLSIQKPEGYWVGELLVDVTLVADMVAYHHWNGDVNREWERKAVNHIFEKQLDDGGWNIYPQGPPEVNATIKAYLALKLAGVPVTDPRMLKAREVASSLGGVPRMNTFSKLYLALLGLYPWEHVPTIPCEVLLIGKWFHVNFWEMSNWSRAMIVPLGIINHFKPTRPPRGNVNLDELFPEGVHDRDLSRRTAEADQSQLQPETERLAKGRLDRPGVGRFGGWRTGFVGHEGDSVAGSGGLDPGEPFTAPLNRPAPYPFAPDASGVNFDPRPVPG